MPVICPRDPHKGLSYVHRIRPTEYQTTRYVLAINLFLHPGQTEPNIEFARCGVGAVPAAGRG